jgi:hypothetical protein
MKKIFFYNKQIEIILKILSIDNNFNKQNNDFYDSLFYYYLIRKLIGNSNHLNFKLR